MKKFFLTLSILATMTATSIAGENPVYGPFLEADPAAGTEIEWMNMTDALAKSTKTRKKILVDFITDWCGWCKKMDATTYKDPRVIETMNKYFVAVKFNAESDGPVKYKGKDYSLKQAGIRSTHEFATFLLNGNMSYPTTSFMSNKHDLIHNQPGYISADDMVFILKYFGTDSHEKMTFDEFKKAQ